MTILDLPTKKQKLWADFYYVVSTRMSHWRHGAAEGAEFQISCKRKKLLRKAGGLKLI